MKRNVLILFLLAVIGHIYSQEPQRSEVTNQLWLDLNISAKLSERTDLYAKIGTKTMFPDVWYKMYTSVEFAWWIPKLMMKKLKYNEKVYVGLNVYHIVFTDLPNVFEISPYQGYTLTWPNRERIDIKHNLELGERFQWGVEEWNYSFGLRLSYEASLIFKLQGDLWNYAQGFYLSVSAKFWWNLISTTIFNDVLRITPGIGYKINQKWKTAFYIGYNYTRNLTIEKFYTNNIIYRFRVYYTIN